MKRAKHPKRASLLLFDALQAMTASQLVATLERRELSPAARTMAKQEMIARLERAERRERELAQLLDG